MQRKQEQLNAKSAKLRVVEAAAAKAQGVVDAVLSATYQFDVRMQPFLIKHTELTFDYGRHYKRSWRTAAIAAQ